MERNRSYDQVRVEHTMLKENAKREIAKFRKMCAQHMNCAGANLVHCPGYADDLRPIHTLNMDTRANRGFPAL